MTTMETLDFRLCCGGLAETLGRRAGEGAGATLLLGVDEDGGLFYRIGHTADGQFTSAFTERLVFCPFCGSEVGGGGGSEAVTQMLPRLGGADGEVETVVARLAAQAAATQIHVSEF